VGVEPPSNYDAEMKATIDLLGPVNAGVKLGHWAAQKSTTWPLE
jgi:hypothetical protein